MAIISIDDLPESNESSVVPIDRLPSKGEEKSGNAVQQVIRNSRDAGVQGPLSAIPTSGAELRDVFRAIGSNVLDPRNVNPALQAGVDLADDTGGLRKQAREEQFSHFFKPETDYGKRLTAEGTVAQMVQPADDIARLLFTKGGQMQIAKLLNPRLEKVPGAFERLESAKAGREARTNVAKLLPSADIATDVKMNRPSGVQVEGQNLIKKTNNPQKVVDKFRIEKNKVLSQVDKLVAENNQPVDPNFIGTRAKLILAKDLKNATPKEAKDILKWVKEEGRWIDSQGGFDTVKANARKRYLYQETQGFQKKQAQGKVVVTSPERDKVRDAFSQAYREAIERTHPDVMKLNARFSGLDQGETAASKLVESYMEGQPSHVVQRAAGYSAGRLTPGQGFAAAIREIPQLIAGKEKTVSNITGKIEKASDLSADLLAKSRELQGDRLLESFMRNRNQTAVATRQATGLRKRNA